MAIYTVKTFNKKAVSKKINETDERQFVSLPYTVAELELSGTILLRKEDFNLANAKAEVVKKIQAELVRLDEHKEWEVEV